ncbi:MAG: alpha/beta hydrolase family protein [Acidobacteriota bacterium]
MRQSACLALLCAPLLGAVDWRAEFEAWLTAEATRLWDAREHRLFALDSRPALERYQQEVREKALRLIGGLPPVKTALNARVTGTFSRPGYRVEKVIFESLPGYRVTANLYLPGGVQGRVPAVLGVAGHSLNGKASATYQHAFVGMARRGMAVLAWDPPGQGERLEYFDAASGRSRVGAGVNEHQMAGVPGLLSGQTLARFFIWDGIRAVDYLMTRPEIDPERLAVAGNSGGGTQAAYLAVFEPRLKAVVSSCYMTRWRELWSGPGPQDAEQVWPGFLSEGLDFADFAFAAAPRPFLITSAIQDYFPIAGARATFRQLRRVFDLMGAEDKAGFFEYDDTHGWSKPRREAAYRWLTKWFFGREDQSLEAPFEPEEEALLWASAEGLAGGRTTRELFQEAASDRKTTSWTAERFRVATGWRNPAEGSLNGDAFEVEPGLRIPASLHPQTGGRGWVIVAGVAEDSAELKEILANGLSVLRIDPRGSGPAYGRAGIGGYRLPYQLNAREWLLGRSLVVDQARDLVSAFRWIKKGRPDDSVLLYAKGSLGVAALIAAVAEPRIGKVLVDSTLGRWGALLELPVHEGWDSVVIPGVLAYFDLPDIAKEIGRERLLQLNPMSPSGSIDRKLAAQPGYAPRGEGWSIRRATGSFFLP